MPSAPPPASLAAFPSPTPPPRGTSSRLRTLVLVLLVTLLARGTVIVVRGNALDADPDAYRMLAESIARGNVYGRPERNTQGVLELQPTAYRPPLYPLLLSRLAVDGRVHNLSVALLHLALGLATVALTLALGWQWGWQRRATAAALLVAFDPILLHQSTLVMTETIAALFAILILYLHDVASRRERLVDALTWGALLGATLGAAALCRPTFLPFIACASLLCLAWRGSWGRRATLAAIVLVSAAIVLSPWAFRNQRVFGRWIITTTHGGYTLLLGNNPDFYHHLRSAPWGAVWTLPSADHVMQQCRDSTPDAESQRARLAGPQRELLDDAMAYQCARRNIHAQPLTFLQACLYRCGQFWNPLPHAVDSLSTPTASDSAPTTVESPRRRLARYAVGAWYVALYLLVARSLYLGRSRLMRFPALPLILLVLCFAAAHVTYWSNLRMRGPIMPALCLLALVHATSSRIQRPRANATRIGRNQRTP